MVMRTLSILRYTCIARLVQSLTTAVYGGVWSVSPQATVVRGICIVMIAVEVFKHVWR